MSAESLKLLGITTEELMARPYADFKVTDESREEIVKRAPRYRSDVRISRGLFYTDKEWQERIDKFKTMKLP